MQKTYHFLSGLPRSGNTALAALIEQHPSVHVGPLSYAQDLLRVMYRGVVTFDNFLVTKRTDNFFDISSNLFNNYYQGIEKPVILDRHKNVGLPDYLGRIERNVTREPKIVYTYRPILEILASFINLAMQDKSEVNWIDRQMKNDYKNYYLKDINEARCDWLMRPNGLLDETLLGMANLKRPENADKVYFLEYNKLLSSPEKVMVELYKFLGVESFLNDFNNISKSHEDYDLEINMPEGTHEVRNILSKREYNLTSILPETIIQRYKNFSLTKEG